VAQVLTILLTLASLGLRIPAHGQVHLQVVPTDSSTTPAALSEFPFREKLPHADAARAELRLLLSSLQGKGYLAASVDSLATRNDTLRAWLHTGPAYRWASIDPGDADPLLLDRIGFRQKSFAGRPIVPAEVQTLLDKLLTYLENNGYPFASVSLDSFRTTADGHCRARIALQLRDRATHGDLQLTGNARIVPGFLARYLDLRPGTPFSRAQLERIAPRLRELPYLALRQEPTLTFSGSKAITSLQLDSKKANRFDFLIGVLPNHTETGKVLLTGSFLAELLNPLGGGERIFVQYEQLRPATREVNLAVQIPYLLRTPFETELKFDLYKRDSTYLDIFANAGLHYTFDGGHRAGVFWRQANTNLLQVDTATILRTRRLPVMLDVRLASFGVAYQFRNLDYRFNPRRGWSVDCSGSAGLKSLPINSDIAGLTDPDDPAFRGSGLYDTLSRPSTQWRLEARVERYLPVLKNQALKLAVQGAAIAGSGTVYQNEQYRIGGNRLLRGFDEESIFAARYAVLTGEYRLLTGQNSFLFAFADGGWYESPQLSQTAYSFGGGITFDTAVGVFGLSYALGATSDAPINLRAGKIHFGYLSLF
jgi:outer membrane protein assembly factor BamA